jgi:hypothetical protein
MVRETEGVTSMERTTPAWCRGLMEFSLWAGIFTGVFLAEPLGLETARATCAVFAGILTLTWLLHGVYLRWLPFSFSWSTFPAIALIAYLLVFRREELGGHTLTLLICLPVFLAIPGAFTERQIARFLAFLCATGGLQVLICLVSPTLFGTKASLSASLAEGKGLTGTLGVEAELTAFLICTLGAAAAFGLWSVARLAPDKNLTSPGGRANRMASPGTNLALLCFLAALLAASALFLCVSLFPFATVVLTGSLLAVLLLIRTRISAAAVMVVLVLFILAGAINLSRPAPGHGNSSGAMLQANAKNLTAGISLRQESSGQAGPGSSAGPGATADRQTKKPVPPGSNWKDTLEGGDWGTLLLRCGPIGLVLLALLAVLLLVEGIKSLLSPQESPPLLAVGAITGFLGLLIVGIWGNFLANPGLAILAAAFCAMTAAGGEYDEEFEEIEIVS